jgi:hypothetical protein
MSNKDVLIEAGTKFLGGFAKKGIAEIKDDTVRDFMGKAWGSLEAELPDLARSLVGSGEVIMSGPYKEQSAEILGKMQADILSFKNKEIDAIDFKILVERRKMAIYALYNAQEAVGSRPSVQKVLNAMGNIATILIKTGVPFILSVI